MQFAIILIYGLFFPALVLGIEIVTIGWRHSSVRRTIFELDNSRLSDLIFFGLTVTGLRDASIIICSLGLGYLTGEFSHFIIREATGFNLRVGTGRAPVDAFLYLAGFTFFDYWNHRV